jgi:hypothetical protein
MRLYLNDRFLALNFQHLAKSSRSIRQRQVDNLAESRKLELVKQEDNIAGQKAYFHIVEDD